MHRVPNWQLRKLAQIECESAEGSVIIDRLHCGISPDTIGEYGQTFAKMMASLLWGQ